jgi:hypothetical protein
MDRDRTKMAAKVCGVEDKPYNYHIGARLMLDNIKEEPK